jgi:hypothetical protein
MRPNELYFLGKVEIIQRTFAEIVMADNGRIVVKLHQPPNQPEKLSGPIVRDENKSNGSDHSPGNLLLQAQAKCRIHPTAAASAKPGKSAQ